jgi:hypothetical protein
MTASCVSPRRRRRTGGLLHGARLLLVQVHELQRLVGGHRRHRRRRVVRPGVASCESSLQLSSSAKLQPFLPLRERRLPLAREAGVAAFARVEAGVGKAGGARGEADVGAGRERR